MANPTECKKWKEDSNSIIALATKTEEELYGLLKKIDEQGHSYTIFREPDFGNAITAIAVTPAGNNKKLFANLPLAGKITDLEYESRKLAGERKKRKASFDMFNTDQAESQNIMEHGESVYRHYTQIKKHMEGKIDLSDNPFWIIPEWLNENFYNILENLPSDYVMERYLTLHDCGKPAVQITVDGKKRFPGHAEASADMFRTVFSHDMTSESDQLIAHFIEYDMDVHMLKADDVEEFALSEYAMTQFIVALSEIMANAEMFGGTESVNFKIKYKTLNQRAKKMFRILEEKVLIKV